MAKNKKPQSPEKFISSRPTQPVWQPDWAWHRSALRWIYTGVVLLFIVFYFLFKPYIRKLPPEITPWLQRGARS